MADFGFGGWRVSGRGGVHPRRSRRPRYDWLEDRRLLSCVDPSLVPATAGVYDENEVNLNTVDYDAVPTDPASANYEISKAHAIGHETFAASVASQYQDDLAGVIDGHYLAGYFNYGANHDKVLNIRAVDGTNWGVGTAYGISGTGAFASDFVDPTQGGFNYTSFDLIPDTCDGPQERVVAIGVTALSITDRDYGNVTVTARLASGGTLSASRHIDDATAQGDTFYGFTAPEGDSITGFSLRYDGAVYGTPDTHLWFDDIGFVTEPVSTDHAPVAADDSYSVDEDKTLTVEAPGLLGNDTDADGDRLSADLVSWPTHGQLVFNSDGKFTYTPDAGFTGTDTFSYVANDESLSSNTTTVSITVNPVNPVNHAPVAADDSYSVDEDTTLTVEAPGVLGNDGDTDGDAVSATLASPTSFGKLDFHADGSYSYTPGANFHGTDTFSYVVTDGSLASKTATVTVTVKAVNDAPTLADGTFSIAENTADKTVVGAVTGSDVDGDSLTYSLVGDDGSGAFQIDPVTGAISVADSSKLDYETTPTFVLTVQATDPGGLSDRATVTVHLTDEPEAVPVAIDILPGDPENSVNVKSHGKIEVAILSSSVFNALDVDVDSLTFGALGSEDSLSRNPHGQPRYRVADVNGDGRLDLVVAFETEKTGFEAGDVLGVLQGRTRDGGTFEASAPVSTKAPHRGR